MPELNHDNYQSAHEEGKLMGALPKKEDSRNIMMMAVVNTQVSPPPVSEIWQKRYKRPFTPYHQQRYGSCTISSQAEGLRLWERKEQFGRDVFIPEDSIDKRYFRLSGGQDTGLYELDALNDFRSNGFEVSSKKYTIDAFTEVNVKEVEQMKLAIHVFRGMKICYAVTDTMYNSAPDTVIDDDTSAVVGFHSMFAHGYEKAGIWMTHTWNRPPQLFTWKYVLARASEGYTCVDSKDIRIASLVNLPKLRAAVSEAVNTPASV